MLRNILMIFVFSVAPLLAWSQGAAARPPQPAQNPQGTVPPGFQPQLPVHPPQPVAPDAPVVTIHGLCPAGQESKSEKPDSCELVLTRQQLEAMVSSINVANQTYTRPAMRSLAASYVTVLALADAGEKAGVEKSPRFQELMKVARARSLADAYRLYLEEKYSNPSEEEIAAYYKQNPGKFLQEKVDRIIIPRVNPKHPQENRVEFARKARELAVKIRERAANGEDMEALQKEAYQALGITSQPPPTEVVMANRKSAFQSAVDRDINALKPGQVTKVEYEASGFNIYKLRSSAPLPLEKARVAIIRDLSRKNIDAALKAATGHIHTDFNEQFFNPYPGRSAPVPTRRLPARMSTPGRTPVTRPVVPPHVPAAGGNPAPAGNSSGPAAKKPASPR